MHCFGLFNLKNSKLETRHEHRLACETDDEVINSELILAGPLNFSETLLRAVCQRRRPRLNKQFRMEIWDIKDAVPSTKW